VVLERQRRVAIGWRNVSVWPKAAGHSVKNRPETLRLVSDDAA